MREPRLAECLNNDNDNGWTAGGSGWDYATKNWIISVASPTPVEPEDLPEEIAAALPGVAFMTGLILSPTAAPESARKRIHRIADRIAQESHGAILDQQAGTLTLPTGVKRLAPLQSGQPASLLEMSWWFLSGPLMRKDFDSFLDLLAKRLPEALPRRYGTVEPPEFRLAETGIQHLAGMMRTEETSPVWYPSPPVADVNISVPDNPWGSRIGFRSGRLTLEIDTEAMGQPGWEKLTREVWRSFSEFAEPFYGQVSTTEGWTRSRGRYWGGPAVYLGDLSHSDPPRGRAGRSWWWRGIPMHPALHAVVLGEPYLSLWPEFCSRAQPLGNLRALEAGDWCVTSNVLAEVGPPPERIAEQFRRPDGDSDYPVDWPFPRMQSHSPEF